MQASCKAFTEGRVGVNRGGDVLGAGPHFDGGIAKAADSSATPDTHRLQTHYYVRALTGKHTNKAILTL